MNAVVRLIVLGLGALALVTGCAVATSPGPEDEGASAGALTGAEQVTAIDETSSAARATSGVVHVPQRLTRPRVSTPGTENSKPADPSPWVDPHGTK